MDNNARNLQPLIEALDDVILELTELAVIKQVWAKDKTKLFLPPEFFIGKSIPEVFGEFGNIFIKCIDDLLNTGERQQCVYPDFDENKHLWYCAKFQKIDSSEEEVRIICVIEDITAKKELNDQLEKNSLELKRINDLLEIGHEISKMGGWEYDTIRKELFLTKQIYEINESDDHIVINCNNMTKSFDKENKVKLLKALRITLSQNIAFDLELELITAKRNKKWVRISGLPIMKNQKVRIFRGILKDITEIKNNQLELIEAKNLAEQVARKRTETLSIMSHEIRTPLNAIIGISNLLDQDTFSNNDIKEYVDHLRYSSNHLLHLINDILDLEKIECKKMELNEIPTNLVSLVNNIYKQFVPFAKTKNLSLNFNHDHQIPQSLLIDDLRLSRILNNLIGNAIKFTEKGEVNIILKTLIDQHHQTSILFKISDTGIGIPEHLHNLIFDKFHQVNQDSHRQQEGSGLGLNITKGLVRLFDSEIRLTSKPYVGSIFEFKIDFKKCLPLQPEQKIESLEFDFPPLPDFKLLIVDDNATNLLVASRQLHQFGINADKADNAYTAIEYLKKERFDVVLVDLHMPGMDGYQLAKYIQDNYPETKVIIFTADVLEEVRFRLKEMGIQYILSKPFKPEEMFELFLEVLEVK
ncbi:response regulator [Pedobacter sp. B4-66]|uniref:response regulator n=1 Tax=Pedobacter sp. B4-66 TaxID=2817280 RepID=UPI001BDAEB5C|nr:response regulator [Pedobacter sp. B4-66]